MRMHSKFVKDLSDKTQISIRQLEAEWKIAQKQVSFDILMEPAKYSHLKVLDGTLAEEIARRVEANVTNPQEAGEETKEVLGFKEEPTQEVNEPELAPLNFADDEPFVEDDSEKIPETESSQDSELEDVLPKENLPRA